MLDIFKQFATDETLENNGTWVEIGGGAKLLVARVGNERYAKLLTKLYEQNREVMERGDDLADQRSQEIMSEVLATTVLLGWEKVAYAGKELAYSTENAKKLLVHKDFRRLVLAKAENIDLFLLREEVAQGNG